MGSGSAPTAVVSGSARDRCSSVIGCGGGPAAVMEPRRPAVSGPHSEENSNVRVRMHFVFATSRSARRSRVHGRDARHDGRRDMSQR